MDTRQLERTLQGWEQKQLPFATARALTLLATQHIKPAMRASMDRFFDEPTPYTLNSLSVTPATKARLYSVVEFKSTASKGTAPSIFLHPQVTGGSRVQKRSEQALQRAGVMPRGMLWVPGEGAKLNRYGNIQPSLLTQILSATRAFGEVGYLANRTTRSKARNKKALDIFVGRPGGGSLPLGVYARTRFGVKPLLLFIAKAQYKARLPFVRIATDVYESDFAAVFDKCLRDALVLQPFLAAA